jgi:sugar lactone lactonase YvrE
MKTKTQPRNHSLGITVCAGAILLLAASAPAQNLFVADSGSGNIYEFTPDGTQFIFASGLNNTATLALDSIGDVFVAGYEEIYKFSPDGTKSTFATFVPGMSEPWGLAFDLMGNLFVSDVLSLNGQIYKFTADGVKSTFASGLKIPTALAFNRAGNLFAADIGSGNIYEISPDGTQSTFASGLYTYLGMAFDSAGDLFVADEISGNIYEITPDRTQSTFASGLYGAIALAFDSTDNLFVSEHFPSPSDGDEIIKITPSGAQSVFASGLNYPDGLVFAPPAVQTQTVYIGNPALPFMNYAAADGVPPLVIMGEYSPAGPLPTTTQPLPSGIVQNVQFYGQNYDFTLYALSHISECSDTNEQTFRVVAAQHFCGTNPAPGTITLLVSDFRVKAGDFLAFAGIGPWYPQQPNDAINTDATYEDSNQPDPVNDNDTATPPVLGELFSVGINRDSNATYGYIADNFGNQGRIYAIGVDVLKMEEKHQHHEKEKHHHDFDGFRNSGDDNGDGQQGNHGN